MDVKKFGGKYILLTQKNGFYSPLEKRGTGGFYGFYFFTPDELYWTRKMSFEPVLVFPSRSP